MVENHGEAKIMMDSRKVEEFTVEIAEQIEFIQLPFMQKIITEKISS